MKKYFTTKTITGLGILTAIMVCLFGLSNVIHFGPLTMNLTLVPIALGACMYGPLGGLLLGFIDGGLNLLVGEVSGFMAVNAWATVLVVLLKTSLAGLLAGLIFMPFKEKHPLLGCVIASCLVPIINTGVFVGGVFLFFQELFMPGVPEGQSFAQYLLFGVLGINFIVEFALNAGLSAMIHQLYRHYERKQGKEIK